MSRELEDIEERERHRQSVTVPITLSHWLGRRLSRATATFDVSTNELATVAISRLLALGDVELREALVNTRDL